MSLVLVVSHLLPLLFCVLLPLPLSPSCSMIPLLSITPQVFQALEILLHCPFVVSWLLRTLQFKYTFLKIATIYEREHMTLIPRIHGRHSVGWPRWRGCLDWPSLFISLVTTLPSESIHSVTDGGGWKINSQELGWVPGVMSKRGRRNCKSWKQSECVGGNQGHNRGTHRCSWSELVGALNWQLGSLMKPA